MDFKFLRETPQVEDVGLEFGHKEIVSTLQQIICKEDENLTIGLFGGWGSGKSSIVESLKKRLTESKVPLVVFDVWKHEGDALRRTFLTELVTKLETDYGKEYFKEKYTANQRLKGTQNSSTEFFSVKRKKLVMHATVLLTLGVVFLLMLLILNGLFSLFGIDLLQGVRTKELVVAGTGALSITLLYKYADYFIKTEKTELKEDRFQDPHEFEQEFDRIIANLNKKTNKIVVAFDNLDRVSGENALKIIATIKTFLDYRSKDKENNKTVFFLIPCDVGSMKEHIVVSSSTVDKINARELYWDEFLRKFFNTNIWIPEFYPTELEKFAVAKLREVNVREFNDDYLSWLIIKVFHENPRQVIQFINILLSNYLLLKQFCESGAFHDRDFYKKNVPQLAKFLLIKQRHAACLEGYSNRFIYDLSDPGQLELINDEKFKALLTQTDDIFIPSLEPYFKYRESKMEQEHQSIVAFITAVTTGAENVEETLAQIDFQKDAAAFNGIIRSRLHSIHNILIKCSLVDQILDQIKSGALNPEKSFFRDLILFFSNPVDGRIFYRIRPLKVMEGLMNKADNITTLERTSIVNHFLGTLSENDADSQRLSQDRLDAQISEVYQFAANYSDELNEQQLNLVKSSLEENYGHNSILETFLQNEQLQEKFITQTYIKNLFENFNPAKSIQSALHLLMLMTALSPADRFIRQIIDLISSHFHSIFTEEHADKSPILLVKYVQLINIHLQHVFQDKAYAHTESTFSSVLSNFIYFLQKRSIDELIDYLPLLLTLARFEHSKGDAITMVNSMFVEGNEQLLQKMLSEQPKLMDFEFSAEMQEQFTAAILKYDSLRPFVEGLPQKNITMLIVGYMEDGELEQARELIIHHRDHWEGELRQSLLDEMVDLFSSLVHASQPNHFFKSYSSLILFVAENDMEALAKANFWHTLGLMLSEKDPMGVQRLAFELFKEHYNLITGHEIAMLIEKLLGDLRTRAFDDDYIFNEALCYLLERYTDDDYNLEYLNLVFGQLIVSSVTTNIFVICARAIERLEYQLLNFLTFITAFLDLYEHMEGQQRQDAQIVLKALQEKMKNNKSELVKEIKARLRKLKY